MKYQRPNTNDALASSVIGFFAIIIIGAILWSLINPGITDITNATHNYTTTQTGNETVTLTQDIWNATLIYILLLATIFLIARAVFEGNVRP